MVLVCCIDALFLSGKISRNSKTNNKMSENKKGLQNSALKVGILIDVFAVVVNFEVSVWNQKI